MYTEKIVLFIRAGKDKTFFGRDAAIVNSAKKLIGITCESEEYDEGKIKTVQESDFIGARLNIMKNSNDTILDLPMRLIAKPTKSIFFPVSIESISAEKSGVHFAKSFEEDKAIVFTFFYGD